MRKYCDTAKGKDKQMCYYMGVGDAQEVCSATPPRACASERLQRSRCGGKQQQQQ